MVKRPGETAYTICVEYLFKLILKETHRVDHPEVLGFITKVAIFDKSVDLPQIGR